MSKKYLTYEELLYHLENDDSDLEYLSEEDDGWEVNDDQTNEAHDEFEEVRVAISQDILHELEGDRSIDNCIQTQELENTVAAGTAAELCGASSGPIVQQPNQTNVKREPKKSILNTKQVLEKPKQIPSGPNAMARDRFFKLRKHLHFVNVQERPPENTDRLWKVRPLYNVLRNRMSELTLEYRKGLPKIRIDCGKYVHSTMFFETVCQN
ncbi:Transposase IS4 [Popillia japonica]|uniref:Transposase IS4 n=1 Tax=Popillia japonica TaxID=7064 RepID=A0AAW1HT44_POPJA